MVPFVHKYELHVVKLDEPTLVLTTVTTCVQVAALPLASVAVHVTVVFPIGYVKGALLVTVKSVVFPLTKLELAPVNPNPLKVP